MKTGSTLFLKLAVITIGLAILTACTFIVVLVFVLENEITNLPNYYPIAIGICVPLIPFFIGLYQAWKLLSYIDQNKAFSDSSTKALNVIKYSAVVVSLMYIAGMPYIFKVAEIDDAPGLVVMSLMVIFASLVIATFAALLQRLLHDALVIKSENDLTV